MDIFENIETDTGLAQIEHILTEETSLVSLYLVIILINLLYSLCTNFILGKMENRSRFNHQVFHS